MPTNKKEYDKNWRKKNREKIRVYFRKWSEKNREKVRIYCKKYRKEHPNCNKGRNKKGSKGYPKKLFNNLRRIAIKKNAEGSHTFGEWELLKKQYGYKCPACERLEPEITLTEDHIVPLSKGGSDYIENIQPLCGSCNSKKQARTIIYEIK